MSSFVLVDVRDYTSMHAYVNQYSRIRGSGRIQYAYHRSSRKKTAASRMWKKNEEE